MPPMTGVASGFNTSAPVRWLHKIGSRLATMVATVITFGRSRSRAPSFTAWIKSAARKPRAAFSHFPFHRFVQIHDHHDAGLNRRAEQRDVADPDGHAEVVAEQPLQEDAAGQRERHGEDDVRRLLRAVINDVKQQEDDEQRRRHDQPQSVLRADLIFVLAAPFNRHAGRQGNFLREARLRFLYEAAEVATLDIRLHEHAQTPVLTVDFAWPDFAADRRHLPERNAVARRRRHQDIAEALDIVAFAALQPDLDGNPLAPGNRCGNIVAADATLDQIQNILRAQAVTRHRRAIHLDVEIRLAFRARRGHADRAGNLTDDAFDLERLFLQARPDCRRES